MGITFSGAVYDERKLLKKREEEAMATANALAERNYAMRQREGAAEEERGNRSMAAQLAARLAQTRDAAGHAAASEQQRHTYRQAESTQSFNQRRHEASDQQSYRERSAQQGADLQKSGRAAALQAAIEAAKKARRLR